MHYASIHVPLLKRDKYYNVVDSISLTSITVNLKMQKPDFVVLISKIFIKSNHFFQKISIQIKKEGQTHNSAV